MPARQLLGGFIPSNGVGTGFSRRALELLARNVFEPDLRAGVHDRGLRERLPGQTAGPAAEVYPHTLSSRPSDCDARVLPAHCFTRRCGSGLAGSPGSRCNPGSTIRLRKPSGICTGSGATAKLWSAIWSPRCSTFCSFLGRPRGAGRKRLTMTGCWRAKCRVSMWSIRSRPLDPGIANDYSGGLFGRDLRLALRLRRSGPGVRGQLDQLPRYGASDLRAIRTREVHGRPLRWVKTEHAYPNRAALMTERKASGRGAYRIAVDHARATGNGAGIPTRRVAGSANIW